MISVVYDTQEAILPSESSFGIPHEELISAPKDITEYRSSVTSLYSGGSVVRFNSLDNYRKAANTSKLPLIDLNRRIYQAPAHFSKMVLTLVQYGFPPQSTLTQYSPDISSDMMNDIINVLLALNAIVLSSQKQLPYETTPIGRASLKLPLSIRGSALMSRWLEGRPVFPGVIAICLMEIHTTFDGNYYELPRVRKSDTKDSSKLARHAEKHLAGFRYYDGSLSRSDFETLLNVWTVLTDEVKDWTTLFGDKSGFRTLRVWCASNSISFYRLRKAITLAYDVLTILSTISPGIQLVQFKPRNLLSELRPIIQEVYSSFVLTYRSSRRKQGYSYTFGPGGKKNFSYRPKYYLSTQAIYPASRLGLLDAKYVQSGGDFTGYISLSIDLENQDVGSVQPLFDPNSNWIVSTSERVRREQEAALPGGKIPPSDVKMNGRRKTKYPEPQNKVPGDSENGIDNTVTVVGRSYGAVKVPLPPGNVNVGQSDNAITSVQTVVSSSYPTSDPVQMARDYDNILFPSRPSNRLSDTFDALRRERYAKRQPVSLFTIQQDLSGQQSALSSSAFESQKQSRVQSQGALEEMTRYLLPAQSYDPDQDIGLQNYLTRITRTSGNAGLPLIRFRETGAINFAPVPVLPITRGILEMNSKIAFKTTDVLPPPRYLAPTYTLITPQQIDGEIARIARLEALLDKVLDIVAERSDPKDKRAVIQGTRKAFARWFFNANSDGEIVGMYPVTEASLNKYSLSENERYPFRFTRELLDSIPLPTDITLENVKAKVNKRTGFSDRTLRRDYQDRYSITEAMLYMYAYRYVALNTPTMSLAVMPDLIKQWRIDIELFGSLFNTINPYASAFPDEPKSLGNFFELSFETGKTYLANPPYDEEMMEQMANKLLTELNAIENITIYVVLPVWDQAGRAKLGLSPGNEFSAYQMLADSPYLKVSEIRSNLSFYDYFRRQAIMPTPVRLMILSNRVVKLPTKQVVPSRARGETPRDQLLSQYGTLKAAIEALTQQVISGQIPFPYGTSFRISAVDQLRNFQAYNPNISHDAYTLGHYYNTPNSLYIPNWFRAYSADRPYTNVTSRTFNWNTIDSFADMFTESERIKTPKRKSSVAEDWRNPKRVSKIVRTPVS
jgi:hypothetical protein